MWSFCPGSSEVKNQCFAFDVHKHLRGECWLKQQRGEATRPKDPFFNHTFFPLAMRAADRASWPLCGALADLARPGSRTHLVDLWRPRACGGGSDLRATQ